MIFHFAATVISQILKVITRNWIHTGFTLDVQDNINISQGQFMCCLLHLVDEQLGISLVVIDNFDIFKNLFWH